MQQESKKRKWLIYSPTGARGWHYWNDEWGYVDRASATRYTDGQKARNLHMVGDRVWEQF